MKIDKNGKLIINRQKGFNIPTLISEGRKYGLTESQISTLDKYLNDKRMMRLINLESFNHDAKAWLSALTGIIAEVLAMDAHFSIWLDKKVEKPRNWILQKLNNIIPTKIDDIAIKALNLAQQFMDEKVLPLKENLMSKLSSKMHDKYNYHSNATYLGLPMGELKAIARKNLQESKQEAKSAINTLQQRKYQTATIGGYFNDDGKYINLRKYKSSGDKVYGLLKYNQERNKKYGQKEKGLQETSKEEKISRGEEIP